MQKHVWAYADSKAHVHNLIRAFAACCQNHWIQWTLITMTAFVPKDIAIKMNLLLERILNEYNDMQQIPCLILISF